MKGTIAWLLLATSLVVACRPAVTPTQSTPTPMPVPALPRSMKGYELYSWPVGEQWHFTLITGTNRTKTVEEITRGEDVLTADGWVRIHVQGADAILAVLSRVPAGEWVLWAGAGWAQGMLGAASDITLPPQTIVDVVRERCQQLGIELQVSE